MNTPTKRESVRQQGSTLGQSAVGPSFLDAQFHRAQSWLKSNPRCASASAQFDVGPLFTGLDAKSNEQRIAEYREKRNQSQAQEINRVLNLIRSINENFAATADAIVVWRDRKMFVTVDQGGKTVYSAEVEIDSPALEAKLRLIRQELEQMKVAALAGLKGAA